MGDIFDFENADIGRLAIHIQRVFKPGEVETLPITTTTASGLLFAGTGLLVAANFIETTGTAAAIIDLLDGGDNNGPEFVPYALSAGQSARDQFAPWGFTIQRGLFLRVTSGSIRGSVQIVRR